MIMEGRDMGEWIAIAQWDKCLGLARPGIIFEVSNAEGRSLVHTVCGVAATAAVRLEIAPVRFRVVPEFRRSTRRPLPEPPKGALKDARSGPVRKAE